jgi:hypothetical protein
MPRHEQLPMPRHCHGIEFMLKNRPFFQGDRYHGLKWICPMAFNRRSLPRQSGGTLPTVCHGITTACCSTMPWHMPRQCHRERREDVNLKSLAVRGSLCAEHANFRLLKNRNRHDRLRALRHPAGMTARRSWSAPRSRPRVTAGMTIRRSRKPVGRRIGNDAGGRVPPQRQARSGGSCGPSGGVAGPVSGRGRPPITCEQRESDWPI